VALTEADTDGSEIDCGAEIFSAPFFLFDPIRCLVATGKRSSRT